jgi:hypothetical protein
MGMKEFIVARTATPDESAEVINQAIAASARTHQLVLIVQQ